MMNRYAALASMLMLLSVAVGAFGAHALKDFFVEFPQREDWYQTATQYLMFHSLAILSVAFFALTQDAERTQIKLKKIIWVMFIAQFFFSGSLYMLTFTGLRVFAFFTPVGGLLYLVAWLRLALFFYRC
jgi:uncharacterized membrane protein YgdD (TMEM256/DUF423 family)